MRPLIDLRKYLVHKGQLQRTTRDDYGETVATSITTVACLVYSEDESRAPVYPRDIQHPRETLTFGHYALLPNTLSVRVNDMLASVIDINNLPVISSAKIVQVIELNHWRYGKRAIQVRLEVY